MRALCDRLGRIRAAKRSVWARLGEETGEVPNDLFPAREEALAGRCTGCGAVGHSLYLPRYGNIECGVFAGLQERFWRSRYNYEMCRAVVPHTTEVCPSLHGACRQCQRRGHKDVVLCRSKTEEEFKLFFERNRHLGRLTRRGGYEFKLLDPIWDRRPRPNSLPRRGRSGRRAQLV